METGLRYTYKEYKDICSQINDYNEQYKRAVEKKDGQAFIDATDRRFDLMDSFGVMVAEREDGLLDINDGAYETYEFSFSDYIRAMCFVEDHNARLTDALGDPMKANRLEKLEQLKLDREYFIPRILIARDAESKLLAINPEAEQLIPREAVLSAMGSPAGTREGKNMDYGMEEKNQGRKEARKAKDHTSGKTDEKKRKESAMQDVNTTSFEEVTPATPASAESVSGQRPEISVEPETKWIGVVINGKFLSDVRKNPGSGKEFYNVLVPNGTKLGGAIDVGGYSFTANESQVQPYSFDDTAVEIRFPEDWKINLTKSELQGDGTYKTVAEKKASPSQLKTALDRQHRKFKEAKEAKRAAAQQKPSPAKDQAVAEKSADARSKSDPGKDRKLTK